MANSARRFYWTGTRKAPAQDRFFIDALDPDLWAPGDRDHWDTCWHTGMPEASLFGQIRDGRTVNHIPGNAALTIKTGLYRTLATARDRLASEQLRSRMDFFPRSFAMPDEYHALLEEAWDRPGQAWIVKPKSESRGRGIHVVDDAGSVPLGKRWMAQPYLANPHLHDGYKYVLRCYLLITALDPLRVYLYREGFMKLASERYAPGDLSNVYAHLTNPDINETNAGPDAEVVFHSFEYYRDWLISQGHDPAPVFRGIRDMAILSAIAAREPMLERLKASGADPAGCYELIGLDCMVDANLKPWLLECNLSLVGLNLPARDGAGGDGPSDPLAEAQREDARSGDFQRIYPAHDASEFISFFPVPRLADWRLAETVSSRPLPDIRLTANNVEEIVSDTGLALFDPRDQQMHAPEGAAAFIWLKAAEGETPHQIAEALVAASSVEPADVETCDRLRSEVWSALAEWAHKGLLAPLGKGAEPEFEDGLPMSGRRPPGGSCRVSWCGGPVALSWPGRTAGARLRPLIESLPDVPGEGVYRRVEILEGPVGFALAADGRLISSGLTLRGIGPALRAYLIDHASGDSAFNVACLELADGRAVLVASDLGGSWDALALAAAEPLGACLRGGVANLTAAPGRVRAIPAPLRLNEADLQALGDVATRQGDIAPVQAWGGGLAGRLVPAHGAPWPRDMEVAALVVPAHARPGETTVAPSRLSGPDALKQLSNLHRKASPGLSRTAVRALADYGSEIPVMRVCHEAPQDGADRLVRALGDL